jgi:hypothetical protein
MSAPSSGRQPAPRVWRRRRLDPDTLTFVLALEGVIVGVFALINPVLFILLGYRLGFDVLATPYLWGLSSIALGVAMVVIPSSKGKRWLMLFAVLFWTFVAAGFIITNPYQPLIATGFAIASAVTSIIAYWRSWVWA